MRLINIHNNKRKIYLFCRDDKGNLIVDIDNTFFPYYYEINNEGTSKSYDGKNLKKIFVTEPSQVAKSRENNSYEADIIFTRRYMIDKIKKLTKTPIKYAFIDIEILTKELPNIQEAIQPISSISLYNSFSKEIKTWYLGEFQNEELMLNNFIDYMQKEKFDLWLSWNVRFDYNYLANHIKDFGERISSIHQTRYGDGEVFYPAGISIVDYLSWFKKTTLNRRKSYALDYIAQVDLGEEPNKKIDFSQLRINIKEKNINDIRRMIKLEEKFKLIDYYDEVRRLSKVEWEDMLWNSRIIDMLLLEEAKNKRIVLPMKPDELRGTLTEKEDFQGAYREVYETGAFFGVTKYDLSSAYPNAIIDFCLDPANIGELKDFEPSKETTINFDEPGYIEINNTLFLQNPDTILPTVVKKLITLKNDIKQKLSTDKSIKIKYDAIKSIVNSAYGVFGNRFFRLFDPRVASATTYLVRDLLHYVKDKIEEKGYKVIYVDTDGVFINSNQNLTETLNELVNQWAKEKYNKEKISIEFSYEGLFEKLLILTKCRYDGWLRKEDRTLERETKGIEAKRKDSTEFMKKFQKTLIDKIHNKESKEQVISWIKTQINDLSTQPLKNIAFPCKLAKKPEDYKNLPIFVRALRNTENLDINVGDSFYYIYINPKEETNIKTLIKIKPTKDISYKDIELDQNLSRKEGIEIARKAFNENIDTKRISVLHKKDKPKDVIAFNEETEKNINRNLVDWDKIVKRNILMKLDTIFEAMKWDIKEVEDV